MGEYILTITNKMGFSCYSTVNVDEVADLGDTINIVGGGMEIFLPKDGVTRGDNYIYYRGGDVEIYLEYIPGV